MPKYYCDYCDTYLTHDSPSVRKTHCNGRKHKENVRLYYQKWLEEQVQKLVDDTTAAYKAGKNSSISFGGTSLAAASNMVLSAQSLSGIPALPMPPMGPLMGPTAQAVGAIAGPGSMGPPMMPGMRPLMGPPMMMPMNMRTPLMSGVAPRP